MEKGVHPGGWTRENIENMKGQLKRIGFAQLPLVCVMFRLMREAIKYAVLNGFMYNLPTVAVWGLGFGVWLTLLGVKLALGSLLQRLSLTKLRNAPEVSSPKKSKLKTK